MSLRNKIASVSNYFFGMPDHAYRAVLRDSVHMGREYKEEVDHLRSTKEYDLLLKCVVTFSDIVWAGAAMVTREPYFLFGAAISEGLRVPLHLAGRKTLSLYSRGINLTSRLN